MLDLLVLRAREPRSLARFYNVLGMEFATEKHGSGPEHMACDTGAGVLEIYPCQHDSQSTRSVRLGFRVSDLDGRCARIAAAGGAVLQRSRGVSPRRATVQDPEGHIIDLREA